jgi:hypothetical protein
LFARVKPALITFGNAADGAAFDSLIARSMLLAITSFWICAMNV